MFVLFVDDDSDTATEGEEEIRARELRKQEVRVEPPIVHTDTGTDTEVKSTCNLLELKNAELPDILSSHDKLKPNKSSDNLSGSSPDSADFDSCVGSPDKSVLHAIPLIKSATAGNLAPPKVKRNFVIPPRDQRKSFGKEFVPSQQKTEPQPLLIIKRTPSKINLPPEVGKPKVALKVNINNDTKKYFGDTPSKTTAKPPKPILKRAETLKNSAAQNKLVKQISLPETEVEKEKTQSFNFEPEDADLNDVDNYIEDLLAKKDELLKPIDPSKYTFTRVTDEEKENVSSSIEDLLKALEIETKVDTPEITDKPDEKIEDLLNWMDNLDHQTHERKVYRSYSDVKYKNLERILKAPKKADAIISKIPKDNLTYFERHMSGKPIEDPDNAQGSFKLTRSKTDVFCNKPRSSVDLDAVTNVDIKKVLLKFEKQNSEDDLDGKPPVNLPKRKSFSSFKFAGKNQENSEGESCKKTILNSKSMVNVSQIRENLLNKAARSASNSRRNSLTEVSQKVESKSNKELEKDVDELSNILKDIEDFVDNTINKIGSSTKLDEKENVETVKQKINRNENAAAQQKIKRNSESKLKNKVVSDSQVNKDFVDNTIKKIGSTKLDEKENEETAKQQINRNEQTMKQKNNLVADSQLKPSVASENNVKFSKTKQETDLSKEYLNLNVDSPVKGSTESVHSYRSAVDSPNLLEVESTPETPTQYSVTVCVTESRIFPQFQTETAAPPVNVDDLYAKVNKQNKKPSPTPRRARNSEEIDIPQRPMRQKSFEGRNFKSQIPVPQENNKNRMNGGESSLKPVAPQRKRSTTASPQLNRKNGAEPKKETVRSLNAPKAQKVEMRNRDSKSKEKDCCLQ